MQNIIKRLDKIESVLFAVKNKKVAPTEKPEQVYIGPKGGILLIIKKGYFDKRRNPGEVASELEKNNYNYQLQVVRNTLNRLSTTKGPLTRLTFAGKLVYVKRK